MKGTEKWVAVAAIGGAGYMYYEGYSGTDAAPDTLTTQDYVVFAVLAFAAWHVLK